MVELSSQANR
jgi:hypothetical protein